MRRSTYSRNVLLRRRYTVLRTRIRLEYVHKILLLCKRTLKDDLSSAATQIHSSLLSISVGAVLLPAAFHFSLSYTTNDGDDAETSLQEQKEDILQMSRGVSPISSHHSQQLKNARRLVGRGSATVQYVATLLD